MTKVTCFISGGDLRRLNVPRVLHGRSGDTEQMEQDLLLPENHQVVFNRIFVTIGYIWWPFKIMGGIYWYLVVFGFDWLRLISDVVLSKY